MDNAVAVASDAQGRMIPEALREAVARARQKGKEPFMVNATAGTTVLGAFDPLEELADVCEEEGLWLHVDVSVVSLDCFLKCCKMAQCNPLPTSRGRGNKPITWILLSPPSRRGLE